MNLTTANKQNNPLLGMADAGGYYMQMMNNIQSSVARNLALARNRV